MMDKGTYMKKFAMWTAIGTAVALLIIGLCFGKVIEESLFAEIAKWAVVGLFLIVIMEVFAFTISQVCYEFFYKRPLLKKGQEEPKDED